MAPHLPYDAVHDAKHVVLVVELDVVDLRDLAVALDEHTGWALMAVLVEAATVDHDLRDGVVGQKRLDGPEAQELVLELFGDLGALLFGDPGKLPGAHDVAHRVLDHCSDSLVGCIVCQERDARREAFLHGMAKTC